jgi:hypothetical protein
MLDSMCPLKAVKCIAYTVLYIYTRSAICQATMETCELNEYMMIEYISRIIEIMITLVQMSASRRFLCVS